MHIDMDAFYAAIEQRDNPRLRGRPIGVRLGKSGALASASYEARKFGVKSAIRISEATMLCPELEIVEADFDRYWEVAKIIQQTCRGRTKEFEPYSVSGVPEEGWLNYPEIGTWEEAEEEAKILKTEIRNNTVLTCSLGVAYAKIPAKLASDYHKPDGLTIVRDREEFAKLFWGKDVRDLFMVGKSLEKKLKALGMQTIGDIAQQSLEYLIQEFKQKRGTYLYNISRGIDDSEVIPDYLPHPPPQSIGRGRTVRIEGTRNYELLDNVLRELSQQVVDSLHETGYYFKTAHTEIEGFTRLGNPIKVSSRKTLDYYTNDWRELYNTAVRMLTKELNENGVSVKKISVRAGNLTQEPQLTLFKLTDYNI